MIESLYKALKNKDTNTIIHLEQQDNELFYAAILSYLTKNEDTKEETLMLLSEIGYNIENIKTDLSIWQLCLKYKTLSIERGTIIEPEAYSSEAKEQKITKHVSFADIAEGQKQNADDNSTDKAESPQHPNSPVRFDYGSSYSTTMGYNFQVESPHRDLNVIKVNATNVDTLGESRAPAQVGEMYFDDVYEY
jgi:hypothetical protein